jgi:serine/threonine-protein kinase
MIGDVLGNYRITDQIGSGGMGIVYRAKHILLGKEAAIKVLKPERCEVAEIVDRFFNEARAASLVKDPGIPEIFDYGRLPEGNAYLVMEMLQGQTLGQLLDSERRLTTGRAVAMARLIAGTLEATHARGIIHRDLKPDNVFVVPDAAMPRGERIKILDFGIAKLQTTAFESRVQTEAGRLMGTPYYMSPEQCRGSGEVDHRTDIYSLGCVLYQMLCGHPPFTMRGSGEVLAAHIHLAPKPLTVVQPEVPKALEELVMRLLEKDPDRRPQTMRDVQDLLNCLTTYSGIETPEPSLAASGEMPMALDADTLDDVPLDYRAKTTTMQSSSGEFVSEADKDGYHSTIYTRPQRRPMMRVLAPLTMSAGLALGGWGVWTATRSAPAESGPVAAARPATPAPAPQPAPQPQPVIVRELVEVPAEITMVSLSIDSEPSGARVYRLSDGVELGRTPLTVEARKGPGSATFLLRKTGYQSRRIQLPVNADGETRAVLDLRDDKEGGDPPKASAHAKSSSKSSAPDARENEDPGESKDPGKSPSEEKSAGKASGPTEASVSSDHEDASGDTTPERGRDDAIDPFAP